MVASAFPTSIDTFVDPIAVGAGQYVWLDGTIRDGNTPGSAILIGSNPALVHSMQHSLDHAALTAIQTKLGIDSSADTTSIDYLLKNPASNNPGHTHNGTYQPLDATLTAWASFNSNGILVQTALDTFTSRSLVAPAAGFTITNPAGIAGDPTFVLANDLAALEALASTGFAVRTTTDTWAQRTITAATANIVVANGSGVSANPTIDIGTAVLTDSSTHTLTNKTFNAAGTGNVLSNIATSMFAANVIDTDITLAANSNTRLATQAATKAYVDNLVTGLQWKTAVRVATTVAGTLASSFENGDTVDGVVLATGNRILIKNQAAATENGIYTVNASGAPSRTTDADTGAELVNATCFVSEGTTNADTQWTCTNNSTITIGVTNIAFAQVSGAGTYSADGVTLTLTGNQFSINTGYVGQASITTLGTVATGTWQGSIIQSAYGGTGNGFTKFTGPTTTEKTFTLPDANDTIACWGIANAFTGANTQTAGSYTFSDNVKALFGTTGYASIYGDATNLIINPVESGSGVVSIGPTATYTNSTGSSVTGATENLLVERLGLGGSPILNFYWIHYDLRTTAGRGALGFFQDYTGSGGLQIAVTAKVIYSGSATSPSNIGVFSWAVMNADNSGTSISGLRSAADINAGFVFTQGTHRLVAFNAERLAGGGSHTGGTIYAYGFRATNWATVTTAGATFVEWGGNCQYDFQLHDDAKMIYGGSDTAKGDSYDVYNSTTTDIDRFVNGTKTMTWDNDLVDCFVPFQVDGSTGNTLQFVNAGAAPATLGGGPAANNDYYGTSNAGRNMLCDPDIWIIVNVGGVEYVVPGYTP